MKYMIMLYGSQQDYDVLAGRPPTGRRWSAEDRGDARVHGDVPPGAGRVRRAGRRPGPERAGARPPGRRCANGAPVVTDGPYPETQEVLAGYTIVECDSFDRATEIAAGWLVPDPDDAAAGTWTCGRCIDGVEDLAG